MVSLLTLLLTAGTVFIPFSSAAPNRRAHAPHYGFHHHSHKPWPAWGTGFPSWQTGHGHSSTQPAQSTRTVIPIPSTTKSPVVSTTFSTHVIPTSTLVDQTSTEEPDEPTSTDDPDEPSPTTTEDSSEPTNTDDPDEPEPTNTDEPEPTSTDEPDESSSTAVPTGTQTSTSVSLPTSTTPSTPGEFWQPATGATWQIQLTPPVTDFSDISFSVYDIDLFDNPASTISTLQAAGAKVICYFSAGTYENWRPDEASFQSSDLGASMPDWPGESWLDTRSSNVRSLMTARLDLAVSKGCDGVDPDNVDAYNNDNGLNLASTDAVDYLTFLASAAHERGLSIGLKNAGDVVTDVLSEMQWQVNEQCLEYNECDLFVPFVEAGKPVFHIEYPETAPSVSAQAKKASCGSPVGFSSVLKNMDLDAWVVAC